MIFSLPAGNSRRRRRLKGPAQMRRSLRGLGGVSHQQASLGIYRGIACYNGDTPQKRGEIALCGGPHPSYYF